MCDSISDFRNYQISTHGIPRPEFWLFSVGVVTGSFWVPFKWVTNWSYRIQNMLYNPQSLGFLVDQVKWLPNAYYVLGHLLGPVKIVLFKLYNNLCFIEKETNSEMQINQFKIYCGSDSGTDNRAIWFCHCHQYSHSPLVVWVLQTLCHLCLMWYWGLSWYSVNAVAGRGKGRMGRSLHLSSRDLVIIVLVFKTSESSEQKDNSNYDNRIFTLLLFDNLIKIWEVFI